MGGGRARLQSSFIISKKMNFSIKVHIDYFCHYKFKVVS